MRMLELRHRHPFYRFAGWAGLALLCILVAITFVYFSYNSGLFVGLIAPFGLIAPAALFVFFSLEKARLWWARVMVALLPMGLIFQFGSREFPITLALFMFLINFFVIVLDKLQGYTGERRGHTPLRIPLGIWLVTIIFSTLVSRFALHGILELIPLLLASTVYVYVRLYIRNERELESLIKAFTVGVCFSLGSGVFELYKGVTYTANLARESQTMTMYSDVFRIDGSFFGPNSFVFFTGSVGLLYGVMFFYWKKWRWKLFSLALAITACVLSIFTYSRGGIVGLAAGLLFLILALPPPKKRLRLYLVIIPIALVMVVGVTIPVIGAQARGTGIISPKMLEQVQLGSLTPAQIADIISTLSRPIMWFHSIEFWKTSPVWGVGHSNFEGWFNEVMPKMFQLFGFYPRHPHNLFVYALMSTGIIGLGCLMIIIFKLTGYLFAGVRHRRTFIGYLSIALISIWILIFIHGLVDAVFVLPLTLSLAGLFFLFLGMSTFVMDAVKKRRELENVQKQSEVTA